MWEDCFKTYLSDDFRKNFRIFEKNRNHIAHNKMIDRQAYESILNSIDLVHIEIIEALQKFHNNVISRELEEVIDREKQFEQDESENDFEEIMESEAGVEIRQNDEIYELFEQALIEFHQDIEEALRFRNDIEVSDFRGLDINMGEQELFEISYKIDNTVASVSCSIDLNDSQGGTSQMTLKLKYDNDSQEFSINYVNGEVYYNDDQGYYMPEIEDEFDYKSLEEAKECIIEYINEKFENLREKVDNAMYRIIKDGGLSPVFETTCSDCGESYICIDEDFAPIGVCLNCGAENDINKCSACNELYDPYLGGDRDYCSYCLSKISGEDNGMVPGT